MPLLAKLINRKEMIFYIVIGVVATAADWMTFTVSVKAFNTPYEAALFFALAVGGLVHYISNKIFTFRCQSQEYGSQIAVYILLAFVTFVSSLGCMYFLISWIHLSNIWARILTTGLLILPNYLLHKHITFNKNIFMQPEKLPR